MGEHEKGEESMSELEVGQKARVRKDLKVDELYNGSCLFASFMANARGKEAEITEISNMMYGKAYCLSGLAGYYSSEMLEPATLSTGDMINALMANPGERYKSETPANSAIDRYAIMSLDDEGFLCFENYNSRTNKRISDEHSGGRLNGNFNIERTWTLLPEPPKPVSMDEAFAALDDQGKAIRWDDVNNSDNSITIASKDWFSKIIMPYMLRRGKWYILEESK